jgi:dihydroorotase-like cyclic amidohydrolase
LIFTKKDIQKLGPYLKMTPPLRSKNDVLSLWHGLKLGIVDIVATDHAPGTSEEKEAGWRDIWESPGGIPGVETLLPLMIGKGVNKGLISLQDLCRMLCERPGKIFHLYPRKGALQVGSDADVVIIDLKKETVISADMLHYKVGWTPYEGMKLKGYPILTMVRGEVIVSHGEIIGSPCYGKFIPMSS